MLVRHIKAWPAVCAQPWLGTAGLGGAWPDMATMEALQEFQLSQLIAGLWRLAIIVFVWAMVNQISSLELRNVHF